MQVVNFQKVISCHHTLDLREILPSIKHQFTSRAYKSLQTELGLVDMGGPDSSRVPLTSGYPASPVNSPSSDALPSRAADLDINRGGRNVREAGNISGTAQPGQFYLPDIRD